MCVVRRTKFQYTTNNALEAYILRRQIYDLKRREDGSFELLLGRFARTEIIEPGDPSYKFLEHETTLQPGKRYNGPPFDPLSRQKREEIWHKNVEWRNAKCARIDRRKVGDKFDLARLRCLRFETFELVFRDPDRSARTVNYGDDDFEFLWRHAHLEPGHELTFEYGIVETIKRWLEFFRPGDKRWDGSGGGLLWSAPPDEHAPF